MSDEHGKNKPLEPTDPMELNGTPVDGDPLVMLDGIIEEYARIGWGAEQIERLFERPFFQATAALGELYGPEQIRARIRDVLSRCGVRQFRTVRAPEPGANAVNGAEPRGLVQIGTKAKRES